MKRIEVLGYFCSLSAHFSYMDVTKGGLDMKQYIEIWVFLYTLEVPSAREYHSVGQMGALYRFQRETLSPTLIIGHINMNHVNNVYSSMSKSAIDHKDHPRVHSVGAEMEFPRISSVECLSFDRPQNAHDTQQQHHQQQIALHLLSCNRPCYNTTTYIKSWPLKHFPFQPN